jgi:FkbM family methyltransferase
MNSKIVVSSVNDITYIITNPYDIIQNFLVKHIQWNNEILLLVKELIKKYNLKHFLNIGSHIGTIAMPISRVINKVTAIEAYYPTYCHLNNNIKLNNITNIETYNIAIGNNIEKIHFLGVNERTKNNMGGMHVITDSDKQNNIRSAELADDTFSCMMYPLDKVAEIDNFDIILVDIEGMEDRFLLGARSKIIKNKPIIITEIWDDDKRKSENMISTRQDIINVITSLGYTLYKNINDDYVFLPNELLTNTPKKPIRNNYRMSFM